jgi:hypothetical protein
MAIEDDFQHSPFLGEVSELPGQARWPAGWETFEGPFAPEGRSTAASEVGERVQFGDPYLGQRDEPEAFLHGEDGAEYFEFELEPRSGKASYLNDVGQPEELQILDPPAPVSEHESGVVSSAISDALTHRNWGLALDTAIREGWRDEAQLANLVFFGRHSELGGRRLRPDDPSDAKLVRAWVHVHDVEVWASIQRTSTNAALNVSGPLVSAPQPAFWGAKGKRFKALVEWAAQKVDLDPALVSANLLAETGRGDYLTAAPVHSYLIGTDSFYTERHRIKAIVPAYNDIGWDQSQTPDVHLNDAIKPTNVSTIHFNSGKDAVLASAVYLKYGQLLLRTWAANAGGDFNALPIPTQYALTRIAFNAGPVPAKKNLLLALDSKDVLIRDGTPLKKYHALRNATQRIAQALHLAEWVFAASDTSPVSHEALVLDEAAHDLAGWGGPAAKEPDPSNVVAPSELDESAENAEEELGAPFSAQYEDSADERAYVDTVQKIRHELALRFRHPDDPGLHQRRLRLRALFASVPRAWASVLYRQLTHPDEGDELSKAFHSRLATATRRELLGILTGSATPLVASPTPAPISLYQPLPPEAQERFTLAAQSLRDKIDASSDPRVRRYRCWLDKLQSGGDDRVISWHRICPTTTGAIGAAFIVGCNIGAGQAVDQAELQSAVRSTSDVETANERLRFITHTRSYIVLTNEMTSGDVHLLSFRMFHDAIHLALHNLELWSNAPSGFASGMPTAYRAIKAWIRRLQDDPRSVYSCL